MCRISNFFFSFFIKNEKIPSEATSPLPLVYQLHNISQGRPTPTLSLLIAMMISNSVVTLVFAALLQFQPLHASPSCPTTFNGDTPPLFIQTCQNSCESGSNVGEMVGPRILTSSLDAASKYDIAGFYFGHQN